MKIREITTILKNICKKGTLGGHPSKKK